MTPDAYCREKAARAGSTVYYASLFLPHERRRGIVATSAFCCEIRAIAKMPRDRDVARTKLRWWRDEIHALGGGTPRHPISIALRESDVVEASRLEDIIAGAEMDLDYNAYPDFAALQVYLDRTGGALATLWAHVCGYRDAITLQSAEALGAAFQMTQIIRDVGENAHSGRIYLPIHELAEHGVTSDDVARGRESDAFKRLMSFQVDRAQRMHAEALAKLPDIDRRRQRPLLATAAMNRALLDEIRADGFRVLTRRTALTPLRKLWLAWRTPL